MAQRTDSFDLGRLGMTSGEARKLDLDVTIDTFVYGGETYSAVPATLPARLEVSRTTGNGWAMRIRFEAAIEGPCMRCLDPASPSIDVDAREVEQPGGGDELSSPYVDDGELDVRAWARDALALAMPSQITCRPDCPGLCPRCGARLDDDPGHTHEREPDSRWAKLSEIEFE